METKTILLTTVCGPSGYDVSMSVAKAVLKQVNIYLKNQKDTKIGPNDMELKITGCFDYDLEPDVVTVLFDMTLRQNHEALLNFINLIYKVYDSQLDITFKLTLGKPFDLDKYQEIE